MTELEVSKLDRKTRDQAKILYLSDYDLGDICEKLNIEMKTLRFYIFGEDGRGTNEKCWFNIKKSVNSVVVSAYVRDKISVLDKTAGIALDILHTHLMKISQDDSAILSVDDLKKLAGIVVDMDKMVRLESGKPTDIVDEIKTMSLADARRILLEDPFAPEIVEAEIVEPVIEVPEIERDKDVEAIGKPWK